MSECNASFFYASYEAAEKCRPVVERGEKQPFVTQPARFELDSLGWTHINLPGSDLPGQTFFYELIPVEWCTDKAEFTFPIGSNVAKAERCCKMLVDITKQTCEVQVLPRSWLADAARMRLK